MLSDRQTTKHKSMQDSMHVNDDTPTNSHAHAFKWAEQDRQAMTGFGSLVMLTQASKAIGTLQERRDTLILAIEKQKELMQRAAQKLQGGWLREEITKHKHIRRSSSHSTLKALLKIQQETDKRMKNTLLQLEKNLTEVEFEIKQKQTLILENLKSLNTRSKTSNVEPSSIKPTEFREGESGRFPRRTATFTTLNRGSGEGIPKASRSRKSRRSGGSLVDFQTSSRSRSISPFRNLGVMRQLKGGKGNSNSRAPVQRMKTSPNLLSFFTTSQPSQALVSLPSWKKKGSVPDLTGTRSKRAKSGSGAMLEGDKEGVGEGVGRRRHQKTKSGSGAIELESKAPDGSKKRHQKPKNVMVELETAAVDGSMRKHQKSKSIGTVSTKTSRISPTKRLQKDEELASKVPAVVITSTGSSDSNSQPFPSIPLHIVDSSTPPITPTWKRKGKSGYASLEGSGDSNTMSNSQPFPSIPLHIVSSSIPSQPPSPKWTEEGYTCLNPLEPDSLPLSGSDTDSSQELPSAELSHRIRLQKNRSSIDASKPNSPVLKQAFTPRLETFFSTRPSIQDLKNRNILIDEEKTRLRRNKVVLKLHTFLEMMYSTRFNSDDEIDEFAVEHKLEDILVEEGFLVNYKEILFGKKIGEGAYGEVFYGQYDNRAVAVKRFKGLLSPSSRTSMCRSFEREILSLIKTINNPHTIGLVGACIRPSFCIVTDFKEGLTQLSLFCLFASVSSHYV